MTDGTMLEYQRILKEYSRDLRNNLTIPESILWRHLRCRQILGVKFYRQKPLLHYIVDFYSHQAKLAIECDGAQHLEKEHLINDKERDAQLSELGVRVLRFSNREIVESLDVVLSEVWETVANRIKTPTP
ncbi:MAG: endonuclease domain-containing protein [Candidatus Berkiella sp.]